MDERVERQLERRRFFGDLAERPCRYCGRRVIVTDTHVLLCVCRLEALRSMGGYKIHGALVGHLPPRSCAPLEAGPAS